MNKAELYEKISTETGIARKDVEAVIESFEQVTTTALKAGEEVVLTGFGAFMAKKRNARMGVNPQKPTEKIQIPTVTIPKFKAGKALKDALKEGAKTSDSAAAKTEAPAETPLTIPPAATPPSVDSNPAPTIE